MTDHEKLNGDTDALLRRVQTGDKRAANQLIGRHRERLRQMISIRLDPKLAVRVDPSDIVQETLVEAAARLPVYAQQRPIQFYPWLRNIAWQRLVKAHRRHVTAQTRSVNRETHAVMQLSDESQAALARQFFQTQTSPSDAVIREEKQRRVKAAIGALAEPDREILILRYLEQMSMREIADTLGIRKDAARQRHTRALLRFQRQVAAENLD